MDRKELPPCAFELTVEVARVTEKKDFKSLLEVAVVLEIFFFVRSLIPLLTLTGEESGSQGSRPASGCVVLGRGFAAGTSLVRNDGYSSGSDDASPSSEDTWTGFLRVSGEGVCVLLF